MSVATLFANADGIRAAIRRATSFFRPPPRLLPSEWAEANVKIPEGNAVPGPYRLANAPYQREPMDMLKDPDCYRVSLQWGAQVGKTFTALCIQGYCVEINPKSQMSMQPSQGDLATWLETKWTPLVAANQNLRRLIAKPRGRKGVNNRMMKSYPGGFMMFAWSGSTKTMRGRSAPVVVCDEVDGYEMTEEGHPVQLLWQRAATFLDERFLVEISTPTVKGASYIETAFEAGDQRRFHVACPDCGTHQTMVWGNVHWPGRRSTGIADAGEDAGHEDHQPGKASYTCRHCGSAWDDGMRISAIRNAETVGAGWKAAKPFKGHASYHINEMYSTFRRLRDIVQSYLDKLALNDLQTFVNVSLAETFEEAGEQADATGLMARRETYAAPVPMGGVYLTAGIDMQTDRLEVEIVAWGIGEETWSVGYFVLWGDPLQSEVWEDLDDLLASTWTHESGVELRISSAALDTGGTSGYTQAAYDYAKGRTGRRLFAIKGGGSWGSPIVASPSRRKSGKNARKVDLFIVGVDEAKLVVMRRLNVLRPGPGYCHFPDTAEREQFDQITAEKLVTRYVKGYPVREWRKGEKQRNEALDCRVYATAALKIMNPNLERVAQRIATAAKALPEETPTTPAAPTAPADAEIPAMEAPEAKQQNAKARPRRIYRGRVPGGNYASR